jgi:hypothetical protein
MIDKLTDMFTFVAQESNEYALSPTMEDISEVPKTKIVPHANQWLNIPIEQGTAFDLLDLNTDNCAYKLIRWLQDSQSFSFEVQAFEPAQTALLKLKITSDALSESTFQHSLAIGYPFVSVNQEDTSIHAPLLVWHIDIKQHGQLAATWQMERDSTLPSINQHLLRAIDDKFGSKLLETWCNRSVQSSADLKSLALQVSRSLNIGPNEQELPLSLGNFASDRKNRTAIFWSAAYFVSDGYLNSIAYDLEQRLSQPKELLHQFAPLSVDPDQYRAFIQVLLHDKSRVIAIDPRVKQQFILMLSIFGAQNGLKTLLVSRSRAQRDALRLGLKELGLAGLYSSILKENSAEFSDSHHCKAFSLPQNLIASARRLVSEFYPSQGKELQSQDSDLESIMQRYSAAQAMAQHISMIDCVLPEHHIPDLNEFNQLRLKIVAAEALFNTHPVTEHPLLQMPWQGSNRDEQIRAMELKLDQALIEGFANRLKLQTSLKSEQKSLMTDLLAQVQQLEEKTRRIENALYDGIGLDEKAFFEDRGVGQMLKGVLNKKLQQVQKSKQVVLSEWRDLRNLHQAIDAFFYLPFVDLTKKKHKESESMLHIQEQIAQYKEALQKQVNALPEIVQAELRRWHGKTDTGSDNHTQLSNYLKQLLEDGMNPLSANIEHQTVVGRLKEMETVLAHLQYLKHQMPYFQQLSPWAECLKNASHIERDVITALARQQPESWTVSFDAWYLGLICRRLDQMHQGQLGASQARVVAHRLADLRDALLKELRKYTTGQDAEKKMPLIQNWKAESPISCIAQLSDLQQFESGEKFDFILFDADSDAQKSEIVQDVLSAYGQRWLLFDRQVDHKTDQLPCARFRYHSTTDLSQLAILKSLQINDLRAYPWAKGALTKRIILKTEGDFDEKSQTNASEIKSIIDQLNKLPNLAKVGIVCLTNEQRNALQIALANVIRVQGSGFQIVKNLIDSGLKISTIHDFADANFDIIFISVVYGMQSGTKVMTESISYLNTPIFHQFVQKICFTKPSELHVFHSIPNFMLKVYALDQSHQGTQILAQLIENTDVKVEVESELVSPPSAHFPGTNLGDCLLLPDTAQLAREWCLEQGRSTDLVNISTHWKKA